MTPDRERAIISALHRTRTALMASIMLLAEQLGEDTDLDADSRGEILEALRGFCDEVADDCELLEAKPAPTREVVFFPPSPN